MNEKRLKNIWYCMKRRCHNPAPSDYKTSIARCYHDKGITVCNEWRYNFNEFKSWAETNGYQDNLTIDRINPDGNYEPNNCRWISLSENMARAKRRKKERLSPAACKRIGRYEVWKVDSWFIAEVIETGLMYSEAKEIAEKLNTNSREKGMYRIFFQVGKVDTRHSKGEFITFPLPSHSEQNEKRGDNQ